MRNAKAGELGARGLANVVYGASLSACSFKQLGKLFEASARETERRVSEFNAQDIANTVWAFAKVKLLDEKLFAALAREAERRVRELNAQDLANMAWAFAKVNQSDETSLSAL